MTTFSTLMTIFTQLREWFTTISAEKTQHREEIRTALKSIYVAALETKMYLADIRDPQEKVNRETEAKLSLLWAEAAVALREIDPDLANRCLLKADYWSDPNRWTDYQIDQSRIRVDQVYDEARRLLFF
ncbi:hypothetical protein MYX82_09615 [Acidobacteria bacterium AH-259-D05]|nr:hypothetical protein [Acidobacteria bacterium AH-259-D05]